MAQTWIALLRGINVGGNNILPMKDLRVLLEDLGFQNVRTYIQSGNCLFATALKSPEKIAKAITSAIQESKGFAPEVLLLTHAELQSLIDANPFNDKPEAPKRAHFFFLWKPAPKADLAALEALAENGEEFHLADRVLYLYAPAGIGRSKLAAKSGKHIPTIATARNLNTVLKISAMA